MDGVFEGAMEGVNEGFVVCVNVEFLVVFSFVCISKNREMFY